MALSITADPVPLRLDASGAVRVGETRITLQVLLGFYKQGYTAEQLRDSFDTLELADIHAVIAYYLRHQEELDGWLAEEDRLADELREDIESGLSAQEIVKRIDERQRAEPNQVSLEVPR